MKIRNALLYPAQDSGRLEYNVFCGRPLAADAVITGCGVDSREALWKALGRPDAPADRVGVAPGRRLLGQALTADLEVGADGLITAVTVTEAADRPLVGISWKGDVIDDRFRHIANSLERNGALAVYLPRMEDEARAGAALEKLDGLFMAGGVDWAPESFGEHQAPHGSVRMHPKRDVSDLSLIRRAIAMDVPMLAVCRGMQGMNIALGGGLIQDVPCYLGQQVAAGRIDAGRVTRVLSGRLPGRTEAVPDPGYVRYDARCQPIGPTCNPEDGTYVEGCGCAEGHLRVVVDGLVHGQGTGYHTLLRGENNEAFVISRGSRWLYDILGRETVDVITSTHHQAVDPNRLGKGLTIVARASDGIVEAIEHQASRFALGLQWHPEKNTLDDYDHVGIDRTLCNAPLRALVCHAAMR